MDIDYGKLAYMQVEDLKRLLTSAASGDTQQRELVFGQANAERTAIGGSYHSGDYQFRCGKGNTVTCDVSFSADLTAGGAAVCGIILNGVTVRSQSFYASAGAAAYMHSFALGTLPQDTHTLSFFITAPAGGHVYNTAVKVRGTSIAALAGQCYINYIEEGTPKKISYGDGRYVTVYMDMPTGLLPMIKSIERQKYCTCSVLFYEGGMQKYDLLYFFIEDNSLYMTVYNIFTSAEDAYTYFLDEDVDNVAAVRVMGGGAAVCYSKGKNLFFNIISRSPADVVPAYRYSAQTCKISMRLNITPQHISAVTGCAEGFGFCVTGKEGSCRLILSPHPRHEESNSTVRLSIGASAA